MFTKDKCNVVNRASVITNKIRTHNSNEGDETYSSRCLEKIGWDGEMEEIGEMGEIGEIGEMSDGSEKKLLGI